MRFANTEFLLLLLVLPMLALFYWMARRRTVRLINKIADSDLRERIVTQFSDRKSILKTALIFAAIFFITIALVRPQVGGKSTLVKKEGIDLLFALDVSKSMVVQDIRPSRLKRAKLELMSLMEQLVGDRVGIISFSGAAFVQSPLTTDYSAARMFLKALSPNDMPIQGTAVGEALDLSHKLLSGESGNSGSRLVVLLTDGEDHGEKTDEAIQKLAEAKIPVFVVGIGSSSGDPIPLYGNDGQMQGYLRDKSGKTVMSRLNESLLRRIATKTGGKYVNLQSGGTLEELKHYVSKMQKQEFESSLYTQYDEKFVYFLWPAFILLLLAWMIDERRRSRWLGLRR